MLNGGQKFRVDGCLFTNSSLILENMESGYIRKCEFIDYIAGRMIYLQKKTYLYSSNPVTMEDTVIRNNINEDRFTDSCIMEVLAVYQIS